MAGEGEELQALWPKQRQILMWHEHHRNGAGHPWFWELQEVCVYSLAIGRCRGSPQYRVWGILRSVRTPPAQRCSFRQEAGSQGATQKPRLITNCWAIFSRFHGDSRPRILSSSTMQLELQKPFRVLHGLALLPHLLVLLAALTRAPLCPPRPLLSHSLICLLTPVLCIWP